MGCCLPGCRWHAAGSTMEIQLDHELPHFAAWMKSISEEDYPIWYNGKGNMWPVWVPTQYADVQSLTVRNRTSHWPVVPYALARECVTWWEFYKPETADYDTPAPLTGNREMATLTPPAALDAGWLLELSGGAARYMYYNGGSIPTWLTTTMADPQNPANYILMTPLTGNTPRHGKSPLSHGSMLFTSRPYPEDHFNGHTLDFVCHGDGLGGYSGQGSMYGILPWLVKGATVGIANQIQHAQIPYICRSQPLARGDHPTWTLSGSAWTQILPAVGPSAYDPDNPLAPISNCFTVSGSIGVCLQADADGMIVTGKEIPDGVARHIGAGNSPVLDVVGIRWPLGIRHLRVTTYSDYVYYPPYFESKRWSKVVLLWRPMGDWEFAGPDGGAGSPVGAGWARGNLTNADLSWVSSVAISGASGRGWTFGGSVGAPGPDVFGLTEVDHEMGLASPPAPGQAVWAVWVRVVTYYPVDALTPPNAEHATVGFYPDATVLPCCLPVVGGGALAGGQG